MGSSATRADYSHTSEDTKTACARVHPRSENMDRGEDMARGEPAVRE